MVGRRSFPFGMAFWQVQTVSLMECIFLFKVSNSYHPCMVFTNISHKNQPNAGINQMFQVIQLIRSMPGVKPIPGKLTWYDMTYCMVVATKDAFMPFAHQCYHTTTNSWYFCTWFGPEFQHETLNNLAPQLTVFSPKEFMKPCKIVP